MKKAIMKRSELATGLRKNLTEENQKSYRIQQNFSRLFKKERKKYFENVDLR